MKDIRHSKVLITGGAGFIGSNLASSLVESNRVVIIDDLSMGQVSNIPKSKNVKFYEHSITDRKFMDELLCTQFIHKRTRMF